MNGLELWNAVEATDPRYTKDITGKAYRGTTVNNVYVAKKITAALGPVGVRWGWRVLEERLQEFGSHEDKSYQALHWLRVELWLKGEDGGKETFENYGVTKAAYYGRNGFVLDDEFPKKSLTDALSKLMLYLGGSADVWLNDFDPHNKYVAPKPEHVTARPSGKVALSYAGAEETEPVAGEPTFMLDGVRLVGEDWIAAAVLTAKRLQPSALIVWWEKAKEEHAKLHKQRPDLNDTLDKLKAKVLAKAETFNGTNNGAGHVTPDQALRAG
jgi:hypothetical protein